MKFAPGTPLGPFEIREPLGRGGKAEVYRAFDGRHGREVALKVLTDDTRRSDLRRFETEARVASALEHPNLVRVLDSGEAEGVLFIAMELVEGRSLRELCEEGPRPVAEAVGLALQIADALAATHAHGVFHRDLKPENVMVDAAGKVKILDFGLAKLRASSEAPATEAPDARDTHPGMLVGTPGYMAPEQVESRVADFRCDQFALGAIVFELLSGKRAFGRPSLIATLDATLNEEAPLAELSAEAPAPLVWILEHCLAKDPEERYAATRDLYLDLRRLHAKLTDLPPPDAPASEVSEWKSLRWNAVALLALGAFLLGLALGNILGF